METSNLSQFLAVLGRSSIESGIVILLVLVAQWLFRKQLSPRWRCALWLLVVVRMFLLFSLGSATSIFNLFPDRLETAAMKLRVPLTPANTFQAAPTRWQAGAQNEPSPVFSPSSRTARPLAPMATITVTRRPARWWPAVVFVVWMTGVLLLAGHITLSSLRLWRRCARLTPFEQAWATVLLEGCCEPLGVRTKPVLLESSEVSSPALVGLFRPRLLLPKGFTAEFSPVELRFVFLHELAHVKRRDLVMNWIVAVLQVIHWFNPLVWFGFARWRADRELACDAMALEAAGAGQNKEYGCTILRLLENFSHPLVTPGLVGILEDKRQLRQRIRMIASHVPGRGWPRLAVLLAGGLAVIGLTDAQTGFPTATTAPAQASVAAQNPLSALALRGGGKGTGTNTNSLQQKGYDMTTSSITNPMARAATIGLLALAAPTTSGSLYADGVSAGAVPATTDTALTGAWVLASVPGQGKVPSSVKRIKIFADYNWCMIQADAKSGVILFHHGGTYTLEGNSYHETVQYAGASTVSYIGNTNGHFNLTIEGDAFTLTGLDNPWKEVWNRLKPEAASAASPFAKNVTGTWTLSEAPTATTASAAPIKRLKICAGGHWCDVDADVKTGVIVRQHGGTYHFKGDEYGETVEYGDPVSMNLVGHTFNFKLKADGHTLDLKGINNPWNEVWTRAE